ncbi:hypothetical protein [Embleya hyalina]|uniref:Uncharacterized protein n=1 Tax=Embleya hyalina TaxID=516124 RepID=A0A401YLM9_9ACTN|nr:hypothetical protein [Embleya hyalina]GCD95515.1 hypothetical protein EHYA_03189 [Embleya hyalina]
MNHSRTDHELPDARTHFAVVPDAGGKSCRTAGGAVTTPHPTDIGFAAGTGGGRPGRPDAVFADEPTGASRVVFPADGRVTGEAAAPTEREIAERMTGLGEGHACGT